MATLYETDFYARTQEQANRLPALGQQSRVDGIDFENIAEEIESMARSHGSELVSRLAQTVEHPMKLAYSPAWEPRNMWLNPVRGQRYAIAKPLRQNPSLKPLLPAALDEAHRDAVRMFDRDKRIALTLNELPGLCPFDPDDVLRDDWHPAPEGMTDA